MAIEPLNSAMTYQAQAAVKPQTVTQVNTEVPEDGQTVNVDATTASVTKVQAEEMDAQVPGMPDSLKKMIADMNKKIRNTNAEAVFGVHEKTNRIMIKILDKDTKEILKEFPPEKTLDMIASIWEMAGILVDEKL